jgi:hypothetical protein
VAEASLTSIFELLTGRTDAEGDRLGERREQTRARIVDAATVQLMEVGYRRCGWTTWHRGSVGHAADPLHLLREQGALADRGDVRGGHGPAESREASSTSRDRPKTACATWVRGTDALHRAGAAHGENGARPRPRACCSMLLEHELARDGAGHERCARQSEALRRLMQAERSRARSQTQEREEVAVAHARALTSRARAPRRARACSGSRSSGWPSWCRRCSSTVMRYKHAGG